MLRQKLVEGIIMPLPVLTRRDTWIPRVAGKVLAVIGMRRSGKTSLLWQELGDRLANAEWSHQSWPIDLSAKPSRHPRARRVPHASPAPAAAGCAGAPLNVFFVTPTRRKPDRPHLISFSSQ
ncbi:hypothetical protein [Cyanobium sp. Tous-M-B4]|uniref:hypothetical protein n=1 Tax=Cyanobium sp. Tous-M-B4 TaxID=2823724 RepID=UPI0020CCFC96|nr:hypothetical protein [Cyanobium sp. Tous-M-B4]MCP9777012.1 hypothetical protein [Cyanobium sp. Tous-M-B4]